MNQKLMKSKPTKEEIAERYGLVSWMNAEEVCIYLGISLRHLDELCVRKTIAYSKPGKDRQFDPREVQAYQARTKKVRDKGNRSA